MKNTIFLFLAAFLFSATVSAQTTVDSIKAKYKLQPMPEALTVEKAFPVVGTYQLNTGTEEVSTVTVTLDEQSKGIIWVDGLPQGKIKAFLKQSPATYRIVAQKTETDKDVPEGTLIFDPSTNLLNIALGQAYDDADPAQVFTLNTGTLGGEEAPPVTEVKVKTKTKDSKKKTKLVFYTATKAGQDMSAVNAGTENN